MSKIRLLSTVLLDQPVIERAIEEGVELDAMPFIEVRSAVSDEQAKEIQALHELPVTAVFTSANAVRAVATILEGHKPGWVIYSLSGATQKAVYEHFDVQALETMNIAPDAAGLAEMIIGDEVCEIVFFCGDKRLDTLPEALMERQITVHEEVVYLTAETPVEIKERYDGILFFSPSAVSSFFSLNQVAAGTVLFAIGNTTAEAIRKQSGLTPVTAAQHSKESLVEEAIQYFKNKSLRTKKEQ